MTKQEKKFRKIFLPYKGKQLISPSKHKHKDGKVGFLLESLFGLEPNTFSGPDWYDSEFKTFQKNSTSPMSLFTICTSRGAEFTRELHSKYGYKGDKDDKIRLNCRVTTKPNKHNLYLDVDKNCNRIYIRHTDGTNDYFRTDDIIKKVNDKLKHTIAVEYEKNKGKYAFTDYTYYNITAEDFLLGVENNVIDLYLKISTNNNGTPISRGNTFSISPSQLKFFNTNDKQQTIRKEQMKNKQVSNNNVFAYGLAENLLMNDKDEAFYKLLDKMENRHITVNKPTTKRSTKPSPTIQRRREEFNSKMNNGVIENNFQLHKNPDGTLDIDKTIFSLGDVNIKSVYDFCKGGVFDSVINSDMYVNNLESAAYKRYGFTAKSWIDSGNEKIISMINKISN